MPKMSIHHVQVTNIIITSHYKDIIFLLFKHAYQIFDHQQEIGPW